MANCQGCGKYCGAKPVPRCPHCPTPKAPSKGVKSSGIGLALVTAPPAINLDAQYEALQQSTPNAQTPYESFLERYQTDPSYETTDRDLALAVEFASTTEGEKRLSRDMENASRTDDANLERFLRTALAKGNWNRRDREMRRSRNPDAALLEPTGPPASAGKKCTSCGDQVGERYHYVGGSGRKLICHQCWIEGVSNGEESIAYQPRTYGGDEAVAKEFVGLVENAVTNKQANGIEHPNGDAALRHLIRSQALIKRFHTQVADILHEAGMPADLMRYEARLQTTRQGKNVDLVAYDAADNYWSTERTVAVFCKSAVSSGSKNVKNNFNAATGDVAECHRKFPKQVVAQAQVLMLYEVDRKAAKKNRLVWLPATQVARTISWYQEVNGRDLNGGLSDSFERVGLLIIDPRDGGRPIRNLDELIATGVTTKEELEDFRVTSLDSTSLDSFGTDLMRIHQERFPVRPE